MLGRAVQAEQRPDVVTFGWLIGACEHCGQWRRALSLLEEMLRMGVQPNSFVMTAALRACEKDGRWNEAAAIVRHMQVGADVTSMCTLLHTSSQQLIVPLSHCFHQGLNAHFN